MLHPRALTGPAGSPDGQCYGPPMTTPSVCATAWPSLVPSGAALLAILLSEEARGVRGVDVLRRSVDRAPPAR
ncbi:hypothetical protein GCM10027270_15010 [Nocardioides ginkgobilobae]